MLRLGIISEIGEGENMGYARVSFDENGIVSGWLAMPSMATRTTKHWVPVEVNAQVACLMDENCEQGAIVLVLWSDEDTPPDWAGPDTMGVRFADGTEIFYDSKNHKLAVNAPDADLAIKCKHLTVEGNINIKGDTTLKGKISAEGDLSVNGDISANEVTAGQLGITLTGHKHPTAGTGSPSTPIP